MRESLLIAGAALIGLAATLPEGLARADGRAVRSNVMGVSEIKPGMKGYGLTVFEGTKPSRFDVEVIGVLKNFRPRQEVILIKTHHPRLEVAKVVAGMSGRKRARCRRAAHPPHAGRDGAAASGQHQRLAPATLAERQERSPLARPG